MLACCPAWGQAGDGQEPPPQAIPQAPALPTDVGPLATRAPTLLVPAQTTVSLELLQPISTNTAKTGDRFELRVSRPLLVSGQVAIPAGSPALGEVIHAQKGGLFGKPGELLLTVRYVEVHGQKIPMRLFRPAQGTDRTNAAMATALAVGIFAAFIRGEQIELPAGMPVSASVAKDSLVPMPNLEPAPTPQTADPSPPTGTQGQNPP